MKSRQSTRAYAEALVSALSVFPEREHPAVLRAFVRLLGRAGLLSRTEVLLDELDELLLEQEGFLRARVRVATFPPEEESSELAALLSDLVGQPVRIRVEEDRRLVAGFSARVDDVHVDASVEGALGRLRARL